MKRKRKDHVVKTMLKINDMFEKHDMLEVENILIAMTACYIELHPQKLRAMAHEQFLGKLAVLLGLRERRKRKAKV
jgi:hypothetical protein